MGEEAFGSCSAAERDYTGKPECPVHQGQPAEDRAHREDLGRTAEDPSRFGEARSRVPVNHRAGGPHPTPVPDLGEER